MPRVRSTAARLGALALAACSFAALGAGVASAHGDDRAATSGGYDRGGDDRGQGGAEGSADSGGKGNGNGNGQDRGCRGVGGCHRPPKTDPPPPPPKPPPTQVTTATTAPPPPPPTNPPPTNPPPTNPPRRTRPHEPAREPAAGELAGPRADRWNVVAGGQRRCAPAPGRRRSGGDPERDERSGRRWRATDDSPRPTPCPRRWPSGHRCSVRRLRRPRAHPARSRPAAKFVLAADPARRPCRSGSPWPWPSPVWPSASSSRSARRASSASGALSRGDELGGERAQTGVVGLARR